MYKFNSKEHIHLWNDKPLMGTSTVLSVIAKPLTWWASGLAVSKLGWTNSKLKVNGKYVTTPLEDRIKAIEPNLDAIKSMSEREFLNLLDQAYKAHSEKLSNSAEAGTGMHSVLEVYVKAKMKGEEAHLEGKLKCFEEWTDKNVESFIFSEGYCYDEELWIGGISDAGAVLKNGEVAIIDFKSAKDAYSSHFLQDAGYDIQMSKNGVFDENGKLITKLPKEVTQYVVVPFGAETPYPIVVRNVEEMKKGFLGALQLYKVLNNFENQ